MLNVVPGGGQTSTNSITAEYSLIKGTESLTKYGFSLNRLDQNPRRAVRSMPSRDSVSSQLAIIRSVQTIVFGMQREEMAGQLARFSTSTCYHGRVFEPCQSNISSHCFRVVLLNSGSGLSRRHPNVKSGTGEPELISWLLGYRCRKQDQARSPRPQRDAHV